MHPASSSSAEGSTRRCGTCPWPGAALTAQHRLFLFTDTTRQPGGMWYLCYCPHSADLSSKAPPGAEHLLAHFSGLQAAGQGRKPGSRLQSSCGRLHPASCHSQPCRPVLPTCHCCRGTNYKSGTLKTRPRTGSYTVAQLGIDCSSFRFLVPVLSPNTSFQVWLGSGNRNEQRKQVFSYVLVCSEAEQLLWN